MSGINEEIGKRIRAFRKAKGISAQQLADLVCKSKATIYKYESGEIAVDINTLYDIAMELNIYITQLLCKMPKEPAKEVVRSDSPNFFSKPGQYYSYFFDGRSNKIVRCVIDLMPKEETEQSVALYMNIANYENYISCEHTYFGILNSHDIMTNFHIINQNTPVEHITISVLSSFKNGAEIWGLMTGVSNRPFMPISLKMLFSKLPLEADKELIKRLKFSSEDIRIMKVYNMLTVIN